jgi:hypothetical protein
LISVYDIVMLVTRFREGGCRGVRLIFPFERRAALDAEPFPRAVNGQNAMRHPLIGACLMAVVLGEV